MELYELNPSQEVVLLQCKYTLHKQIVNIITSVKSDDELNFDVLENAFNKVVERNDCLRIRFVKKDKKLMQQFLESVSKFDVPRYEFESEKEQLKFIARVKKKAIKFKKGVIIEPYFIKTYDGKYMILLKVCHLILDMYGISMIYKDLFEVYNALMENKELPALPSKFEDVVIKDLKRKNNKERTVENLEFFTNYLNEREEPYYAGLHGDKLPLWQKQLKKGKRSMKMFFLSCDTKGYIRNVDKDMVSRIFEYCKNNSISPANFMFFTMSVCMSKMNGDIKNMIPLELFNCRGTAHDKNCAGTKVQSSACYTEVDKDKSFKGNFEKFLSIQAKLYRHINFSDQEFEMLLHKTYKSSMMETYYSLTFSFIPMSMPSGLEFEIYSNEKCSLPAYVALLYDDNRGDIRIAYDCQIKIINEDDINVFHDNYLYIINQIIDNDNVLIKDIELKNK